MSEVEAEIAALVEEIAATGLVRVVYAPDCDVVAYVNAADLTVVPGVPHADLKVWSESGEHIGWLVYGLPVLTVEAYEADPEGHREEGLRRVTELSNGLSSTPPEGE